MCETLPSLCPVAAARRLQQAALENGHHDEDPFLVTDKSKTPPTKQGMIKAFRRVAIAKGLSEEEAQNITGHMLRPMGAQFMARKGIEFYKIQLFCRWGSDAIVRYLREVPLENAEKWLATPTQPRPSRCRSPEVEKDGTCHRECPGNAKHTDFAERQAIAVRDRRDLE